jgi:hypothetical protein
MLCLTRCFGFISFIIHDKYIDDQKLFATVSFAYQICNWLTVLQSCLFRSLSNELEAKVRI